MADQRSADRLAIMETLARYSWAMTDKDWDAYRACFTADATVDYSTAGGPKGTIGEAAEWLAATAGGMDFMISHGGNVVVDFDGDERADVRSIYKVTMRIPGDQPTYLEAHGFYRDRFVRDGERWLIAHKYEEMLYLR